MKKLASLVVLSLALFLVAACGSDGDTASNAAIDAQPATVTGPAARVSAAASRLSTAI